jgi:hypothetical protein
VAYHFFNCESQMIQSQKLLPPAEVLDRLLHLLCRGLPAYAMEINPWTQPGHERLHKALANLAEDRRLYAQRTARAIADRDGRPDPGPFPLEFTGLNDVSIDYLAREIVNSLRIDAEILEALSAQVAEIPDLHDLTEEVLGNTIAHAEILEKLVGGQWAVGSGQ